MRTPHLDQLAAEGTRFTHAYSECPVCIPARTSLITGRQAHRNGMPSYNEDFRVERKHTEFLGTRITAAGYQTHIVGKRHWNTDPSYRAGFESVVGQEMLIEQRRREMNRPYGTVGLGANEVSPVLSGIPPHLYSTDWIVDRSIEFLRYRDRTAPFFLWTSLLDPHPPFMIHEPFYSMYDDAAIPEPLHAEWAQRERVPLAFHRYRERFRNPHMSADEVRKARGVYYGMVTNLDFQLGRLFATLMERGEWDNTVVIYTSDHGELLGDYGSFFKSRLLDGAARVPLIVRLPPHLRSWSSEAAAPSVNEGLVQWPDLMPTLCDLAGTTAPDDICGRSLRPALHRATSDDGASERRDGLHMQIDRQHAWVELPYKYLYFEEDGAELLFNLQEDPGETRDLSHDDALRAPLRRRFMEHLEAEGHPALQDGRLVNDGMTIDSTDAAYHAANVNGWPGALSR